MKDILIENIDFEVFETIKSRLFFNYCKISDGYSSSRWDQPFLISPIENLKTEISKMKEENENLKSKLSSLSKDLSYLQEIYKFPNIQSIQSIQGHEGIISFLKKTESDPVILSCSYCCSGHVNNLLIYNNDHFCKDKENIWFCCQFKSKMIQITGYLLRSKDSCYLKGWKLEGSNDGQSWNFIDEKGNQDCLSSQFKEVIFPYLTSNVFSYFKFTFLDPLCDSSHELCSRITYFEFAEIILNK
jgi:hypothetical protein